MLNQNSKENNYYVSYTKYFCNILYPTIVNDDYYDCLGYNGTRYSGKFVNNSYIHWNIPININLDNESINKNIKQIG
jgi:hypothetical protein